MADHNIPIPGSDSQTPSRGSQEQLSTTASPLSQPLRTPSAHAISSPRSPPPSHLNMSQSPHSGHRASFADNMRGVPSSPRHRHPSMGQQALQDLLNNPPTMNGGQSAPFAGRDWKGVQLGEIVDPGQVRWAQYDTSVEEATNVLVESGAPNVVLLSDSKDSHTATGTFDYSDLNAYLLLVVGLARPADDDVASFDQIAQKGREGKPIPLRDVKGLGKKEPLITLPKTAKIPQAMEVFGGGVHRILIVEEDSTDVVGILTQLRLVKFFWENRQSFPVVDQLYPQLIKDLNIGSHSVYAINGDRPLTEALELMHNEGITSLPVLDNQNNVIGNISHVDVRLLTKSTSLPLLHSSCIHFISVILSERGMNDGKDSFPVFHVNPFSTLAHTVAKLVATRSHRMWVVESPSPASSGPPTPAATTPAITPSILAAPSVLVPPSPIAPLPNPASPGALPVTTTPAPAISASAIPGASLSGRLSGVISLTDILNLFAKASGLHPSDPDETRRARRTSSSSSMRRSVDSGRSESLGVGGRRGSVSSGVNMNSGLSINRGRPGP
ncbi:hypothetical protein GQ43DRAFT_373591 [Delitschia confertaspora ATCC 74209]|uniref:Protein SDS23 n=1 Tax=Delitschia confertaspora ATCC 74209 TaxID=1513339 RepID=A0A9P4JJJ3_9PLEO|nr:hypothetical protein GQ43DRAFT_373591 [Delitschia confertaspora ATCC 74209]